MDNYIFKNYKSKFLNFIVKNKLSVFDYNNLIDKAIINFDDVFENGIPSNYIYEPCALQIQEMYSRADIQAIRNIFYTLLNYSDKNEYKNNKRQIDKFLINLQQDNFDISSSVFHDLIIQPKNIQKYFKCIKISVEKIGSSFFKIIYNCFFSDSFYYKFWLASTSNFVPVVEFNWSIFKGLTYNVTSGIESKKEAITKLEAKSYKCIKRFLNINAPGIFCTFVKDFPCTLSSLLSKNIDIYKKINTLFFDSIIDTFSNNNSRYFADNGIGIFIPISLTSNSFSKMYLKYFHDETIYTPKESDLSWFSILHFLLSSQIKLLTEIKNKYFHHDLYGKKIDFAKEKEKINTIGTIIEIIKEPYEIIFNQISDLYKNSYIRASKFFDLNDYNYIELYKRRIDYLLNKINSDMDYINVIYEDRYAINNDKKNISLQWMAIILTLVTIFQPIIQCKIDKKNEKEESETQAQIISDFEKKIDDNFKNLEKVINETSEKQTEDNKTNIENLNNSQQKKLNEIIKQINKQKK